MDLNFLDRFSKNKSNFKFHENPSSESRVPCGRTPQTHDEAFRHFANAPKIMGILSGSMLKLTSVIRTLYVPGASNARQCVAAVLVDGANC